MELVVAAFAFEVIVALVAAEVVITMATAQAVVAVLSFELIVLMASDELIAARTTEECVFAESPFEGVAMAAAVGDVVPITGSAVEGVVIWCAGVVERCTGDRCTGIGWVKWISG